MLLSFSIRPACLRMLCLRAAVAALGIPDRSSPVADTAGTLLPAVFARDSGSGGVAEEAEEDAVVRSRVRTN